MKINVIGTGSQGNSYVFSENDEYLIVEAGINFSEVNRIIKGRISKVKGCLISHEHKDHSRFAKQFSEKGLKLYSSKGTAEAILKNSSINIFGMLANNRYNLGGFSVMPFDVTHNAKEPFGFIISHSKTNVLFATDLSNLMDLSENEFDCILIEANYDENLFNSAIFRGANTHGTANHLSIQQAAATIATAQKKHLKKVILIHGSNRLSPLDFEIQAMFENPEIVEIAKNNSVYYV